MADEKNYRGFVIKLDANMFFLASDGGDFQENFRSYREATEAVDAHLAKTAKASTLNWSLPPVLDEDGIAHTIKSIHMGTGNLIMEPPMRERLSSFTIYPQTPFVAALLLSYRETRAKMKALGKQLDTVAVKQPSHYGRVNAEEVAPRHAELVKAVNDAYARAKEKANEA